MREILFRGRCVDEHNNLLEAREMVYGYVLRDLTNQLKIMWRSEYFGTLMVSNVDPKTVSQYTGWNDRHQTKIFENDVVEFVSGTSLHRYLIWWQREGNMLTAVPLDGITFNGSDYWNGKFPKFDYSTFCLMMLDPYGDFRDIRVIGNIHDNPELLEE